MERFCYIVLIGSVLGIFGSILNSLSNYLAPDKLSFTFYDVTGSLTMFIVMGYFMGKAAIKIVGLLNRYSDKN